MAHLEKARRGAVIEYPDSDGKPMGDTVRHILTFLRVVLFLRLLFARDPRVFAIGNNFIYYTEDKPEDCICPDVYVVKDVEPRPRRSYKVWEESGKIPGFVLEIVSRKTHKRDKGEKKETYRALGVREYFLFDPEAKYVKEGLRAYRRDAAGAYRRLRRSALGRFASREIGLELGIIEGELRFFDAGAAVPLPMPEERIEAAAYAEAREALERELREQAEEREMVERAEKERECAEKERECAEKEHERAEKERECARADAAEERAARLEEELARLRAERAAGRP